MAIEPQRRYGGRSHRDSGREPGHPMQQRSIFLVGMMAAGKSTVGRHLAALSGLAFRDADQIIEQRTGADIAWIFDREGEAGFRIREEKAIDELTARSGIVLATGGGAVLRESNRLRLRSRGTVVYLQADPETLAQRARHSRNRPLLRGTDDDPLGRIASLCRTREPLYREVAHHVVAVGQRPAMQTAAAILEAIDGH